MAGYQSFYKEVMFLDKFECVYCGKQTKNLAIDHYIPQAKRGPDCIENLFACCINCNSKKQHKAPYQLGMFPRFGRFRYVTEWAEKITMEAVELQKSQVVQAKPLDKPGLAYKLWEMNIIPTKQPLGRSETWVFWGIAACVVLSIIAAIITAFFAGWSNGLAALFLGAIITIFCWGVGLAVYYENREKTDHA